MAICVNNKKKVYHSQCKTLLGNVHIYLRCFALQGSSPKMKQNSPPFNRWFLVESIQICFLSFCFRFRLTFISRISCWFSFYWSFSNFISNSFLRSRKKERLIRGSSRAKVLLWSVIAVTSPTLTYMGRGREGRFEHFLLILSGRGS